MKSINTAAAILWASAFVLAALVITQAGRLPANPAYAGTGVHTDGLTLITTNLGRGQDSAPYEMLYVLDNRSEVLLAYEIEDAQKRQILLRGGADLQVWFRNARR